MKMQPDHYIRLRSAITPLMYKTSLSSYLEKGLSQKRWRWDLLWAWDRQERSEWIKEVYEYCNDEHIDTALRKITYTTK